MARRARPLPLALAVLAGLGGGAVLADSPASVPLAVVITDARGQGLRNPKPSDLEITEDGQKRTVSSVTARPASPRLIGLLLDDFHVSAGHNTNRIKEAALAFVDQHVRPTDAVVLMQPLDPQTSIKPAESLDDVRERIRSFLGRKNDYAPRSPFEAEYLSAAEPTASRQRAQVMRAALEALATALREPQDAAKALILVTEGFPFEERNRTRTTTLRTTARAAALASLPIYIVSPSAGGGDDAFTDAWRTLAAQTGGALLTGAADLSVPFGRIAADLGAQYLVRFESSGKQDGGFHGLQLVSRRAGAVVRGPSGYWAPFGQSRFGPLTTTIKPIPLLTPHVSGLIQPWFRMSPGTNGKTLVTFMWRPRREAGATTVSLAVIGFDGARLHEARVAAASASDASRTYFDVAPGPVQISMAITTAAGRVLDTDVRYVEVPRIDGAKPVITAVEFIRPRSLPEFMALKTDVNAVPTEVRDFMRQDRLLVRVRAFAGVDPAAVRVQLLNRSGQVLMDLPPLPDVDGAAQFELPFARYPRGEYRLAVRASHGSEAISQLLSLRLIG